MIDSPPYWADINDRDQSAVGFAYGDALTDDEKATLDEKLATREMEIQGLKEKILYLSRARETARKKIEGLINRIEILISPRSLE